MELRALVAKALLAGAESTEILGGPGDHIIIQEEVDSAGLVWTRISICEVQLKPRSERRVCPGIEECTASKG